MESSVNFETLRLLNLIDMFTEALKNDKIIPFSKARPEIEHKDEGYIYYDDENIITNIHENIYYPLVADSCVNPLHHDIISYWPCDDPLSAFDANYNIFFVIYDDGSFGIQIQELDGKGFNADNIICIDAKNGWYFLS